MNINEVKEVVDRIVAKKGEEAFLQTVKIRIDNRTTVDGLVEITFDGAVILVDPTELKKLIDKKITEQDTTQDEVELKNKAK